MSRRGQTVPSVGDLGRIAQHFGIGISVFFRSEAQHHDDRGFVARATNRVPIGSPEPGLIGELLSPTLSGAFEMIRTTFSPRSASDGTIPPRAAEDGVVLISGRLTLTIGERTFQMGPGDSCQSAQAPYTWRNDDDVPAVAIWIIAPPIY